MNSASRNISGLVELSKTTLHEHLYALRPHLRINPLIFITAKNIWNKICREN